MKTVFYHLTLIFVAAITSTTAYSQGVVISDDANATPHGSAMLDVQSTEKGFLPPRMSTIEREAIINAASGLVVYDEDENSLFLYNGTEWVPLVAGTGSRWEVNGENIFYNEGNVGIGTTTPTALLHTSGTGIGQGNVLFVGEYKSTNPGPAPIEGAGTRMMWYPDKAAFRAGRVWGNAWNTDQIGAFSSAWGSSTRASNDYSTAWGNHASASGSSATAWGWDSEAIGSGSTAWGFWTKSIGNSSTAWGYETEAAGYNSTAWGDNSESIGSSSTAWGFLTKAIGTFSTAWGYSAKSFGYSSTAWGLSTQSSGWYSTAWGVGAQSFSYGETAVGGYNTTYTPVNTIGWNSNDRLFVIGNGINSLNPSDALVVLKNGNTGFGTSTPDERLHVEGNIHVSGGDRTIFNRSDNSLAFGTNNQQRMHITSTGEVVIGNAAPTGRLHVRTEQGVSIWSQSTGNEGYGLYAFASSPSGITIGVLGDVNSPSGYSAYFAGVAGSRNYFQRSVGIGTENPNELLEVAGNIHVSGGNRTIFNRSNNSLAFGTNNTEQMRITSAGRIGIGETSPTDRLSIKSDEDENALRIVVGTTTRLRVYATGGVGIGSNMASNPPPGGYLAVNQGISIGTTDPSIFQLRLSADLAAKPTSSSWTIFSDARLKKNVQTIENPLERMLALRGVTYQWIDPATQGDMDGTYTGMIAQEVEKIFPEWIREDADGFKTLTVIGFEGIVVEALRELREEKNSEIAALKAETLKLKAANEKLQNQKDTEITELNSRLQSIETSLNTLIKQQELYYSQSE